MAKDDMSVIVYKILRYMYACMKAGVRPDMMDMCYACKMFQIPRGYWNQIVLELIDNGYVKGFMHFNTKDGLCIQMSDQAGITLKGVQYLEDNSKMKEVKNCLGKAFEIVLSTIPSQWNTRSLRNVLQR